MSVFSCSQFEKDPNSYANTDEVRVEHVHLVLNTDFEAKTLSGPMPVTHVDLI